MTYFLSSLLSTGLITFINCFSVKLATKVQNIFTAAKLIAIAVIIVGGLYMICMGITSHLQWKRHGIFTFPNASRVFLLLGNTQYLSQGFEGSTTKFGDIATAFYSGLWAYDGWYYSADSFPARKVV